MIVKEAGVGKWTFYNYFQNKEDVYEQIIDSYFQKQQQKQNIEKFHSLSLEQQLLYIFVRMYIVSVQEPIIRNFILQNEHFFIGKINYSYLLELYQNHLNRMISKNFSDCDTKILTELGWNYIQDLLRKEEEYTEKQMKKYVLTLASIYVKGYMSDYKQLAKSIDFETIENFYH